MEGRREDGANRILRSLVLVSVSFPIAWAALVCLFALYFDLDHGLILDLRWNCFVVVLGQLKGFPLPMVFASFRRYHHSIWSWVLCLLLPLGLAGRLPGALLDLFGWGCWKNRDYLGYEVSFWLTGLLSRVSEVVFAGCLPIYVLFLNNRRQ